MTRLVIIGIILSIFAYGWNAVDVINLRVVGQPSMTGPLQKNLEQPFFESLQEKTDLPIRVDYRTVDKLGYKDDYQLAMLKSGMFDLVSLRFLQNGQEEPSILGVDLPGLNPDFQSARQTGKAYESVIDANLQKKFEVKLLGLWTFGPQVILCNKPINQLSDLRGLKVRVGGSAYDALIKSQGGIPIITPFDQVLESLTKNIFDCVITSGTSAYSARWVSYMTHMYPIATQMGINGLAIRLNAWNKFSERQKQVLQNAINVYIDQTWNYSEKMNKQATDCIRGNDECLVGIRYGLTVPAVIEEDKAFMKKFALTQSYPVWAAECDKIDPNCSLQWKTALEPILNQTSQR